MFRFRSIIIFALIFTVTGCGKKSKDPQVQPPTDCSIPSQNQYVYDLMNDFYFWYKEVPVIDPTAYASPEDTLDALRYKTLDRFSSIADQQTQASFLGAGQYVGLGMRLKLDESNRLFVLLVFTDSPADRAGIVRGTEITKINGELVSGLASSELYDAAWGDTSVGTTADIEVILPAAVSSSLLSITREVVTIDPTHIVDTFVDSNGVKFGYLLFNNFFGGFTSIGPLNEAFSTFNAQNIEQLIVDLRYNGGGAILTAQHLASLIGGGGTSGRIFTRTFYNDKYTNLNENFAFDNPEESLSLERVYVITSGSTCSASEMLINGLSPHIEVVTIGETTCGKPVGFNPQSFCSKVVNAVNFEFRNSENTGDFYGGLASTCASSDDVANPLGSLQDEAVSIASYYQLNGQCAAARPLTSDVRGWHEIDENLPPYMMGIY